MDQVKVEPVETQSLNSVNQADNRELAEAINIPNHLVRLFPETSWADANPNLANALSGGPSRDGIPAIDNPEFVNFNQVDYPNEIQAIVLEDGDNVRVYPYNILTWHEIVNDVVDGQNVAITFCPLCGSAIAFKGETSEGQALTFGVSGSLLESNMIMFDRETESLWQQSTGETLAGKLHESTLEIYPIQLLTMGEIEALYPSALILSENTGHARDYKRNPYTGYETNDRFAFEPSGLDTTLPLKEIIVAFRDAKDVPTAIPWQALRAKGSYTKEIGEEFYNFIVTDSGQLTIADDNQNVYPFYFEMWFSFAVQHEDGMLIELE